MADLTEQEYQIFRVFCNNKTTETEPAATKEPPANPPLSHINFVAMATRLSQKSSAWASDTAQSIGWGHDAPTDPVPREMLDRYLQEMRNLLNYMDELTAPAHTKVVPP